MGNKNENLILQEEFNLKEFEGIVSSTLEDLFDEIDILEKDKDNISNPDALGQVVLDEVWKQFGNQIGLDITSETTIQKYDREHPENYDQVGKSVLQDKRYKDAKKEMKEQQMNGKLKDKYTGKDLKVGDSANLDHVVPRKELYENDRRKQANLGVSDLANKEENLKATNESLNKSKGAKSNKKYIETRTKREKDLIRNNERANEKVDKSNMSMTEKKLKKEKNDKALKNKLAADSELMNKADKNARNAINKDIAIGATKEVGKKAGKDALKSMAISALFALLKEVMNGFIRFLKEKTKSFKSFLSNMKEAIGRFFYKINSFINTGASTLIGTIISEIFGPIVNIFKKLSSLIKQGVSSVMDAIKYLRDKSNKNKPFSVKVAQVGKIITTALVGGSALFLGEVFEKELRLVPGFTTQIPLVGTLANMIGLFLASLVSGLVGAIVINLIDKFIAKKIKSENNQAIINNQNDVLNIQKVQRNIDVLRVDEVRENTLNDILDSHANAKEIIGKSLNNIFNEDIDINYEDSEFEVISENQSDLLKMQQDLKKLL